MDKEELRAKAHILNPAIWILDNEFINENQHPIEFDLHRFMLQPYADSSPEQVIMKSAQIGWSVKAILKSVHACALLKMNVIYALPTRNASAEFVVPKVNPMLQRNPKLAELVRNTDNKNVKSIGDRWLYFRGTQHMGEAVSTSADMIIADEYDLCDQAVLSMMQSRLQFSKYRWFWRFSNPSIPGYGVHELFQQSDQMHWFVKCPHCNHNWYMGFKRDDQMNNHYIDQDRVIFACGKCHKEIGDDDRQSGEWVAKFPDRKLRGYWISQLMVPWVAAELILKQKEDMDIQAFHNMVLGLPYQAAELLISREAILRGVDTALPDKTRTYMGVDVGMEKHWVLGNEDGIFMYGKTESWEEIEMIFNMHNATVVIDALPDFTIPQRLAKKYSGRVFVHYYLHDTKAIEVSTLDTSLNYGVVKSDRTKLFDMIAGEIANGAMRFYQTPEKLENLIYHFENMYRIVEQDTRGIARGRWETKEGKPDHWAHAFAYYRVARGQGGESGGVRPINKPSRIVKTFAVNPDQTVEASVMVDVEKSLQINERRRK